MTELKGLKGLSFTGAIEGVKISPKLLLEGKFPIIDVASIGIGVKGKLFGGDIDAGLIGGILKLDKTFNIIGPFDSTTPVAERIFFVGVQGSFSLGGVGGFSIRFALSELGPLGIFISASLPTGIVVYAPAGLTINDFAAGVEFFKTLPSIEDPFALRNPEFGLPTDLTAEQWLESVKQQVAGQAKLLAANPNLNGFTAAFTSPMVITGSAKLYTLYASKQVFNAQVIIKISTDGKFLIVGKLNFANDSISISGKLYADLPGRRPGPGAAADHLRKAQDGLPQRLRRGGHLRRGRRRPADADRHQADGCGDRPCPEWRQRRCHHGEPCRSHVARWPALRRREL